MAGILIVVAGVGVCFFINALSFVAVVYSLVAMDKGAIQRSVPVARGKGQLREGLRYVKHEPRIGIPLLMMGLVGTLAYEFQVSLPVLAKETFHGGAETYGFLTAFMGAGAVVGGLVTATRGKTGLRALSIAAIVFGVAILVTSVSPVLGLAYGAMALVGWGSVSFLATGNSTLQLGSDPSMRGRVMALWAVAFLGSTPIGGPLIGWVIEQWNARSGWQSEAFPVCWPQFSGWSPGPGRGPRRTRQEPNGEAPEGPVSEGAELPAMAEDVPVPAAEALAAEGLAAEGLAAEGLAAEGLAAAAPVAPKAAAG